MTTPTLASLAAPTGGATRPWGGPAGAWTTPTLAPPAAPGGSAVNVPGQRYGSDMKLAFVFPGQGSQAVGMMDGFAAHPVVRETFAEASAALGEDLWALSLIHI